MSKLMFENSEVNFQKMKKNKNSFSGKNTRKTSEIQRTRQFEEVRLNKYVVPTLAIAGQ